MSNGLSTEMTLAGVMEAGAREILKTPKFCDQDLTWAERNNHVGILLATIGVDDETGTTIPGLTLQLEVKRPIVVERCLYEFGLFLLEGGCRRRVYQLNVCPLDKRSHNSPAEVIVGPHEHIGDLVLAIRHEGVCCGEIATAFKFYCQRINLSFNGNFGSPL
jgi:hypothetical protein